MSYVFDALQRSQEERGPADLMTGLDPIELLERAERESSAQRSLESVSAGPAGIGQEGETSLFPQDRSGSEAAAKNPVAVTEELLAEERRQVFSRFQTLEVQVPKNGQLASLAGADCPAAEAFRLLGVRLRDLRRNRELKNLLITSTVPQEGKSFVSANLACTLGYGAQQKVLILEGDVRRPTLSQIFGLKKVPGLSSYMEGKRGLTDSLYYLDRPGIWILPVGEIPRNPLEVIQSPLMPPLMQKLRSWFDWIVIDSPPVLPMADTSVWARMADGILLVARHGTTKKRKLLKGMGALDPDKLIGALLNSSKSASDTDYYYYRSGSAASDHPQIPAD
jgi:capsular exopolysaccharide synthesis family protein